MTQTARASTDAATAGQHRADGQDTPRTPADPAGAARRGDDVPAGPGGHPALIGRRVFRTPVHRRVVYAVIFEALAIVFTTLILAALGNAAGPSAVVGVVSSVVALVWNMIFNTLFERWERWSGHTGRPLWVRVLHALCFETGLIIMLVPAVALILQVGLWEAFVYEAALIIFFLIYTAVYAWLFDRVFGLPDSAQPGTAPSDRADGSTEPAESAESAGLAGSAGTSGSGTATV